MEVVSKFELEEVLKNRIYNINYGILKHGSDTQVDIDILGVSHLSVTKSCGCTTPTVALLSNGLRLTISYDNTKIGTINQTVTEKVQAEDKEIKTITFHLKGTIVR
jgi:hypothetical protein